MNPSIFTLAAAAIAAGAAVVTAVLGARIQSQLKSIDVRMKENDLSYAHTVRCFEQVFIHLDRIRGASRQNIAEIRFSSVGIVALLSSMATLSSTDRQLVERGVVGEFTLDQDLVAWKMELITLVNRRLVEQPRLNLERPVSR